MTLTTIKLKAARKKGDKTVPTIEFDFGTNTADAMVKFGSDVVHAGFIATARQQLSDFARALLTRKKNPLSLDQVREEIVGWKPGIKRRGKTQLQKAQELIAALTPEERAQIAKIAGSFAPPETETQRNTRVQSMTADLSKLPHNGVE